MIETAANLHLTGEVIAVEKSVDQAIHEAKNAEQMKRTDNQIRTAGRGPGSTGPKPKARPRKKTRKL